MYICKQNEFDMDKYNLNFNGYWVEDRISGMPNTSGIYFVYRCIYDKEGVILKELIYIGQSENVHDRIKSHEKKDLFKKACLEGETLCYSVAEVPSGSLNIVENALIFAQKPKLNDRYKDEFKYNIPVSFMIEGRCKLMKYQNFTIK